MRFLLVFFLLLGSAFAEGLPQPQSASQNASEPDSIRGLIWNKWETENFIVLSIDFRFGDRLRNSLESDLSKMRSVWGIENVPMPAKCKVVCVPDSAMLKKFFSLDRPKFETKLGDSGEVKEFVIWIDEERVEVLGEMILSAFFHDKPFFLGCGIPIINFSSPESISEIILSSDSSFSSGLFSALMKDVPNPEESRGRAVAACLFLRKEFGIKVFSLVASSKKSPEEACGFSDTASMEKSFSRFVENLKEDLKFGRTPDGYLSP